MKGLSEEDHIKLLEKAKEFALTEEYDSAFEILDSMLQADENDLDALRSKGNKLELKAFRIEALKEELATSKDSKYYLDEALKCYEKIFKFDPDNILNLIDLADHWSGKEKFEISLSYYDKAIKLLKGGAYTICHKDECEEAFYGKSELLRDMGKEEEANQCKKEGLEFFPTSILLGGSVEK